jgi:hypothetical protein
MEIKTYKLKTFNDVLKVVNPENLSNFLTDFNRWLAISVIAGKMPGVEHKDAGTFNWIDDGKTEAKITIEIKP